MINCDFNRIKDINSYKEEQILNFFCEELSFYDYGVFKISRKKFDEQPRTLKVEILKKNSYNFESKDFSPKKKSILFFLNLTLRNQSFNFTLHTCLLKVSSNYIEIFKEVLDKHNVEKFILKKGKKILWQNRFLVESKTHDIEINNISQKNWPSLKKKKRTKNSDLNFLIVQSLPLFLYKGVKIVPFLSNKKQLENLGIKFYFHPSSFPLHKKNFF